VTVGYLDYREEPEIYIIIGAVVAAFVLLIIIGENYFNLFCLDLEWNTQQKIHTK